MCVFFALIHRILRLAKDRLDTISHQENGPDITYQNELPNILLDLMHYEHDDLVQHSLVLLDRHFSSEREMFDMAVKLQLLVSDESIRVYNAIEHLLVGMNAYLKVGPGKESRGEISPVQKLTKYCYLGEVEGYEPHQINQNMIISFGKTWILNTD